jgi:hypothetical protein
MKKSTTSLMLVCKRAFGIIIAIFIIYGCICTKYVDYFPSSPHKGYVSLAAVNAENRNKKPELRVSQIINDSLKRLAVLKLPNFWAKFGSPVLGYYDTIIFTSPAGKARFLIEGTDSIFNVNVEEGKKTDVTIVLKYINTYFSSGYQNDVYITFLRISEPKIYNFIKK